MKILLVTPSYSPIIGGTETFVHQLAINLNALGIHTDVLTFNMDKKWKPFLKSDVKLEKNFTVFRVSAVANPFAFLPINPINLMLRTNVFPKIGFIRLLDSYDIVHFCDEEDLTFPFFSIFVKKPKIMHSLTPMAFDAIKRNFFQRQIFQKVAQMYIPCSFQIGSYLKMGIPASKILDRKSIGVNVDTFYPNESKRLDNLILFVGRLQKLKGVHILLEALSCLKQPVNAIVIGPFDQNNPKYIEELKQNVDRINRQGKHRVELLGRKDENELVPWYQKATFLVAPHLDRICGGLTTLEALSCATPVIATGDEVIKDRINGLLIMPNDVEQLASAMNQMLENPDLRRKLGSEGRRIMVREYSWTKIAKDLVDVYKSMVNT